MDRSRENDATSSATRKSLFLTSKSEMLTRKSLFLTRQTRLTPSWRDGLARHDATCAADELSIGTRSFSYWARFGVGDVTEQKHSMHTRGLAADILCPQFGMPLEVCRQIARSGLAFDQGIHEFGRGATWDSPKTAAAERTTDPSQHRNRLRAGFGLLHFPRAVFEAGLKDPKNNNGRCGSARLTRPFRKAPNRCPIRDSSQKERPTLEFFSQER